ncbi:MAG: hypothetical protein EON61_22715 [Alphaproteobacteria bacterium]|jgi:hypothetical protein|nr:MAG: hypothetical protein EON61_22715 [Alphaproteobacteria bacterium]
MRATLLALFAAVAFTAAACDAPKEAAAPAPAPVVAKKAEPIPEPEPTVLPGMSAPWASEAEWVAACTGATPAIPEAVCTCASKALVKEVGAAGLYNWGFEWFINRNGMGQVRGKNWMETNGHDAAKQQKLADEVRKCYA